MSEILPATVVDVSGRLPKGGISIVCSLKGLTGICGGMIATSCVIFPSNACSNSGSNFPGKKPSV